ncbi:helix-turn-helix transcriptional regulator [Vibrio metschnikovii]|uniref:Helix-turn-helix domain-containing protein n=3 Tax=Bacteria TaxID=2 RepID=A0AAU6VBT8_UNCXX|nr:MULTISPECIES: helix-turn-helix transcriptional regulator [unclassified Vibrio]EKO3583119.1 helix-turn-helix transcriptional regulator [Vibrio metschnikovii]EKO3672644.1 helix-turn-helix transcriptional regulator [Vibrio metschnikovii]EKO3894009.1 helix-turn-helix transcriptional regulator [Vibrio metschnikovii]EKO3922449.1 helix-turn-helix transcriptional regulator [Vibrio metschnikovii]MDQ2109780.1 helix-turn-helix transcriptional regulator [Vibrio sp. 2017_1457_15]
MQEKMVSYSSILGVVVANKRKELGVEQSVLAESMGLSQASYSRLESGKSTFSVDQMFECAKALGIDPEVLFHSVVNTVNNLQDSEQVSVQAQLRANATKAKSEGGSNVGTFIAGAALGALIVGLAGKSK